MATRPANFSSEKLLAHESDETQVVYIPRRRTRWSLFRSWFGSFSLGALITAALFTIGIHFHRKTPTTPAYKFASTDPLPTIPWETVLFESNPLYSERPSDDTDVAWNLLLPPGRGYVYVPDSGDRGLAPGEQVAHGEIYSVAMYHQLHCLARLRKMHWLFKDAIVTGEDSMARMMAGRTASDHVQHCFDYLRQSIFCAGDMTLEWPKVDGASSGVKVDGWGIPHQCKSKVAIDAYMDRYHFNESMNFDAAG